MDIYDQSESLYQCDICARKFTRKYNLRRHITKSHTSLFRSSCALPDETAIWQYASKSTNPAGISRITLNTVNIDAIHKWIEEYGHLNNAIYVRTSSKRSKNNTTVYYEQNRCQHYKEQKEGKKKKRTKGRGCPSKIFVSVKTTNVSEISISENHSHTLDSPDILHYRKPSEAVKRQFMELFNTGLGPAAAYNKFTDDIKNECGSNNEWMQQHCDRSKVPDLPWVYKFFSKKFEEKYGSQGNYDVMMNNLKTFLKDKEDFCRFKELENDFVIAICTPLMQRISTLPAAGEVVFIDSTGGVDRFGLKVFLLIVDTKAGGCPVGVLITTCETITVISEAFSLYLTFISEHSFGGRGKRGPKCFITDDCEAEIVVLKKTFPETTLLLCIFHFMKAVYQWLRKSENGVLGKDQLILYYLTKKMVYAETEEIFHINFLKLSELPCTSNNKKIESYFSNQYINRKQWALCYRYGADVIIRNSHTDNYTERAMRIIKDEILSRRQALCPSQLVDYFTIAYDNHYKRTIIDIATDENCRLKRNSELNVEEFEKNYEVNELLENIYEVLKKDGKVRYTVDAEVGCCSCLAGINGDLCKHIKFLTSKLGLYHSLQFPITSAEKQHLYYIATGENMPQEFFIDPHEEISFSFSPDGITTEVIEDDELPSQSTDEQITDNEDSDTSKINSSFTNFIQEVNVFCEKFEGQAEVAEALNQATIELKNLQNGPPAKAISALKCFNRNLSCHNLYIRNSKKIAKFSCKNHKV